MRTEQPTADRSNQYTGKTDLSVSVACAEHDLLPLAQADRARALLPDATHVTVRVRPRADE
jgi:hypothetical protein